MARVKVTDQITIIVNPGTTVTYYPTGDDGVVAPDDHINAIVDAGKGERLSERGETVGTEKPAVAAAAGGIPGLTG